MDIANGLSLKTHITRITINANKPLGLLGRNMKAKSAELREIAFSYQLVLQRGPICFLGFGSTSSSIPATYDFTSCV